VIAIYKLHTVDWLSVRQDVAYAATGSEKSEKSADFKGRNWLG
jgi:hypothetical protein